MKLNFKKTNKNIFVKKTDSNYTHDWKKVLLVSFVLFFVFVLLSFGVFVLIKNESFIDKENEFTRDKAIEVLDQKKLDFVVDFFNKREERKNTILNKATTAETGAENKDVQILPVDTPAPTNKPDTKPKTLQ